jgi:hypothetical protein
MMAIKALRTGCARRRDDREAIKHLREWAAVKQFQGV